MITLCTVSLPGMEGYLDTLLKSVVDRCPLIEEIVICNALTETQEEDAKVAVIGIDRPKVVKAVQLSKNNMYCDREYGHAEGLHRCLEFVTREYVLFSDPDVFFYPGADQVYMDCMKKHDLGVVGVSHHWAHNHACGWFPLAINCMMKTSWLPGKDWKKGRIKYGRGIYQEGYAFPPIIDEDLPVTDNYMVQGAIPECVPEFVHYHKQPGEQPIGFWYDIGCNLYLWCKEKGDKWLGFQTLDTQTYQTGAYRSNFKLKERFKNQKLIWHLNNGYRNLNHDGIEMLRNKYEESKA